MPAKFIIAPEAEQDLADAYGWYEQQRLGLGDEFLSCVEAGMVTVYCIFHTARDPRKWRRRLP